MSSHRTSKELRSRRAWCVATATIAIGLASGCAAKTGGGERCRAAVCDGDSPGDAEAPSTHRAAVRAASQPCLVFVHGLVGSGNTSHWPNARAYWHGGGGADDFIARATAGGAPHYVIGYDSSRPYWAADAAGHVAEQLVRAARGAPDGGGNRCPEDAGLWVVAHSMGGTVLDYVLGNSHPDDPSYDDNGPYDEASRHVDLVVSLSGAHRGAESADAVCADWYDSPCSAGAAVASHFGAGSCVDSAHWLRSTDDVQVRRYASSPARTVFLTGGYEAIFGASACLSGEDDGVVQFASQYACAGSTSASYDEETVCGSGDKQEKHGFRNLDTAHQNHIDVARERDEDTRLAVRDGFWRCGDEPCAPGTTLSEGMTTAALVAALHGATG